MLYHQTALLIGVGCDNRVASSMVFPIQKMPNMPKEVFTSNTLIKNLNTFLEHYEIMVGYFNKHPLLYLLAMFFVILMLTVNINHRRNMIRFSDMITRFKRWSYIQNQRVT